MYDTNFLMDEIEKRKEDVARAITMAIVDGDEKKYREYFPILCKKIKNNKIFIFKRVKNNTDSVAYMIENLLDKISDILQTNVRGKYYDGAICLEKQGDFASIKDSTSSKLRKLYKDNKEMFLRLRITESEFVDFYKKRGIGETIKLTILVNKLKIRDKNIQRKQALDKQIDKGFLILYSKMFKEFSDKYNVKSIEDLTEFYVEVCSCLLKEDTLTCDDKLVVEKNKKKLISRVKDDSIVNNRSKLRRIKKRVEDLYENEFLKKTLDESNLKEFFAIHNIKVSKNNVDKVLSLYRLLYDNLAINMDVCFDEGIFNVSVFKEEYLNRGHNTLNELVIHETIHSLESGTYDNNVLPMNGVATYYLNEVIVQYLTLKALEYMDPLILGKDTDRFNLTYNYLLPALDVLVKSSLWNDLLCAKLDNNYYYVVSKIGNYAFDIANIFNDLYSCRNMLYSEKQKALNKAKAELKEIVYRMEQKR